LIAASPSSRGRRFDLRAGALGVVLLFGALVGHAAADNSCRTENFAQWLRGVRSEAAAQGMSAATLGALDAVQQDPKVLRQDRTQPSLSQSFVEFAGRLISADRLNRGKALLGKHADTIRRMEREYGVPGPVVAAFWGLETDFGKTLGNYSVPSSLATLACDSRRSGFFRDEFINALKIIDRGDVALSMMSGSWAGAMGNMQFMPSAWLRSATDGDGDGKRDLWNSTTDALVSAGHFLAALGWRTGMRWGREILLPEGFDYLLLDQTRPLADWSTLGVRDSAGRPLAVSDTPARLIAPSGREGPAFIAYPNFDVIMQWNRSEYYAISVGRLADRIAGGGKLVRPIPEEPRRLPLQTILNVQQNLAARGFDVGPIDGLIGPSTRRALAAFQRSQGWIPDGFTSTETLQILGLAPPAAAAPAASVP